MNHHHYHHRRNKNKIKQKQKALRQVESVECLEMIEKLFKNCAQNPSEKKYRKVKFETNAKIKAAFESGKSTTSNESAVQCFLTLVHVCMSRAFARRKASLWCTRHRCFHSHFDNLGFDFFAFAIWVSRTNPPFLPRQVLITDEYR